MNETLEVLIHEVNEEIEDCKKQIKACKRDSKTLLKTKDDVANVLIGDYVIDDNINRIIELKDSLDERVYKLKKIKYRLDVAKRMMNELN